MYAATKLGCILLCEAPAGVALFVAVLNSIWANPVVITEKPSVISACPVRISAKDVAVEAKVEPLEEKEEDPAPAVVETGLV